MNKNPNGRVASPVPSAKRRGEIARLALAVILLGSTSARGATIDILWYTFADPLSEYRTTGVPGLAAKSATDPNSSGLNWNVTFWSPSDPVPDFGAYDLLFVETGEAFRTGAPGGPLATPDYSGILNNEAAITAARGDRTFVDGADAEFHAIRGDSGRCAVASCGLYWDGAPGHVIDAIDWAGSGNGLGIFASLDGEFAGSFWWNDPKSFLHDELNGAVTYFHDNLPVLSAAEAAYPINQGLTSVGLSHWNNSFHAGFAHGLAGYTEVVGSTAQPGYSLAIATTAWVDAPTFPAADPSGSVPEPASGALLLAGLGALVAGTRRGAVRRCDTDGSRAGAPSGL